MTGWGLGLADAARERELLLRIIDTISQGLAMRPLAQGVAELITDATDTDVCFVLVLDADGLGLTLMGATPPFDEAAGSIRLALGEGVSGWVAAQAEPVVLVEHKRADARYRYIPELRGEDYTSMASVPMTSRPGIPVGVLNVHTIERRDFTEIDLRLLSSIGRLLAGAVENARLHERLARREQARERFAAQTVALLEAERRRLAAEIHDGISQRIVGLSFHLSAAAEAVGTDPVFAAGQIDAAGDLAAAALDETRRAIAGLRPSVLDDLGLAAGLESLARSVGEVPVTVEVDLGEVLLPDHVETALYRIVQESLQNVVKHAAATGAVVRLRAVEDRVELEIGDDGIGFATATPRPVGAGITYGLAGMRERADLIGAELSVTSGPGGDSATGTTVRLSLPAHAASPRSPGSPDRGV
ncbi:MAG: GAF domain-containing sensor histidine kinase [Propionibacteriales bacterium]|nr:GAF domain-containing sensor histidine kinase [Propionibacteriales bacterium]